MNDAFEKWLIEWTDGVPQLLKKIHRHLARDAWNAACGACAKAVESHFIYTDRTAPGAEQLQAILAKECRSLASPEEK